MIGSLTTWQADADRPEPDTGLSEETIVVCGPKFCGDKEWQGLLLELITDGITLQTEPSVVALRINGEFDGDLRLTGNWSEFESKLTRGTEHDRGLENDGVKVFSKASLMYDAIAEE